MPVFLSQKTSKHPKLIMEIPLAANGPSIRSAGTRLLTPDLPTHLSIVTEIFSPNRVSCVSSVNYRCVNNATHGSSWTDGSIDAICCHWKIHFPLPQQDYVLTTFSPELQFCPLQLMSTCISVVRFCFSLPAIHRYFRTHIIDFTTQLDRRPLILIGSFIRR